MSQEVVIVGAGICGMCSALALAKKGFNITIYERDVAPPEGGADAAFFEWKRRGVAQFRHPHAFLGLMCTLLESHYPDLIEAFWEAGARKVTFREMLPPRLEADYVPKTEDENLWLLMCRRATIETVLRRYVEQQAHISINNLENVSGLTFDEAGDIPKVTGIKIRGRENREEKSVTADVVIDASGRSSQFATWLEAVNVDVKMEKEAAEIVYYTRHYKLREGETEPPRRSDERSAGDLGYLKFGVFPGEAGHFAVIICLPVGETILREAVKNGAKFDAMLNTVPGVARWLSKAESTTQPFGFADIHAVWKHFVITDKPQILNFFAVGDAAVRTNPLYGRGCSISALHAHLLADVLTDESDPIERALAYHAITEHEIRPIYKASLNEDKQGIRRAKAAAEGNMIDDANTFKKWLRLAVGDAVSAAARDEIHVFRGVMRTFNLLEKPGDFLREWPLRLTILRYLFRGRHENAKSRYQPGPTRLEMIELVEKDLSFEAS